MPGYKVQSVIHQTRHDRQPGVFLGLHVASGNHHVWLDPRGRIIGSCEGERVR